jgi:hypothetical protein
MKNRKIRVVIALAFVSGLIGASLTAGKNTREFEDPDSGLDTAKPKRQDTVISVSDKKVLFIGDSHTSYSQGWQDRLAKRTGMSYINTAIGGKTTSWMLEVLKNNIHSGFTYCIIWGGANDMAGTVKTKTAIDNVQKMVDICNSRGVKPIVMTGFSPKDCIDVSGKSAAWQPYPKRYEAFQQMLQDSIKGATVIKSHFITRKDRDCGDFCCHMTASGHIKMADSMISKLKFMTIR